MLSPSSLHWLPKSADWLTKLNAASDVRVSIDPWSAFTTLANHRIDFIQTNLLEKRLRKVFPEAPAPAGKPMTIALLTSSTTNHLAPGICIGALRRGIWVNIYQAEYGQYRQELEGSSSGLNRCSPDVILFSFDAPHLTAGHNDVSVALNLMKSCWRKAKDNFGCAVIQQAVLPVIPPSVGNSEHQLAESRHWMIQQLNVRLRELAAEEGVHVLAIDAYAQEEGIRTWHDPALWNRAKQEIHPRVSHLYGDLVGRLLAALRGCSSKCLVLDLDNTLWGGVIGDDGLEGILLGQGSAMGEAFLSFQRYVLELSTRGIILAVCSKNDEVNAVSPFEQHPEMILRRKDVACFVANWRDKAANLKHIAETLNIGLDSLVFVDDDPAERALVRQELPMVSVPELSDDPSEYFQSLSDSGYFEALTITAEDRARCQQYQANTQRDQLRKSSTDMAGYLASMEMELQWKAFDSISVPRIVQLMNKTNQFNLTTKRYSSADVTRFMNDPHTLTFEFRLIDRFGDNGIIAVVIGCLTPRREFVVDTWLMSCRVLGRKVEETMLNVIGTVAIAAGAKTIVGHYKPTLKNGMVREHYQKLHFDFVAGSDDGSTSWSMDLGSFSPKRSIISVEGI